MRWRLAGDDGDRPALLEHAERHTGRGELAGLELLHVRARTIINRVPPASQMPFRWTINAYRGCSHACVYCFARPTHEFLGFGVGEDFERRIVVKVNAVERLRSELRAARWAGEPIAMGTNTDPYQPVEGRYRLTRGIVEELAAARNPFSILTKSTLITRDIDVLAEAARHVEVQTGFSIGTLDEAAWRATEPHTPNPRRRVEALARLREAGIPCGAFIAPVIPGISDSDEQLEETVAAVVAAGATWVTPILLYLRPGFRDHYMGWLRRARPDLVEAAERRYRRAYAPADERAALAGRVRAMVRAHGGPAPGDPGPRRPFERRPARPVTAAPADAQLRLV
ncbi:radical SAM protein [Miltoncostaea marina]|uniref:radical SAM protein n=1 Tax=Miltoncostaea marina TaxID=2843215 RepID=UPI003CCE5B90